MGRKRFNNNRNNTHNNTIHTPYRQVEKLHKNIQSIQEARKYCIEFDDVGDEVSMDIASTAAQSHHHIEHTLLKKFNDISMNDNDSTQDKAADQGTNTSEKTISDNEHFDHPNHWKYLIKSNVNVDFPISSNIEYKDQATFKTYPSSKAKVNVSVKEHGNKPTNIYGVKGFSGLYVLTNAIPEWLQLELTHFALSTYISCIIILCIECLYACLLDLQMTLRRTLILQI